MIKKKKLRMVYIKFRFIVVDIIINFNRDNHLK